MDVDAILDELIQLSHELGKEERQLAILGGRKPERRLRGRHLLGKGVGQ
jgi:hypothetical protein